MRAHNYLCLFPFSPDVYFIPELRNTIRIFLYSVILHLRTVCLLQTRNSNALLLTQTSPVSVLQSEKHLGHFWEHHAHCVCVCLHVRARCLQHLRCKTFQAESWLRHRVVAVSKANTRDTHKALLCVM